MYIDSLLISSTETMTSTSECLIKYEYTRLLLGNRLIRLFLCIIISHMFYTITFYYLLFDIQLIKHHLGICMLCLKGMNR